MNDLADLKRTLSEPYSVCLALGIDAGAQRTTTGMRLRCGCSPSKPPARSVWVDEKGELATNCFRCGSGGDVLTLIADAEDLDIKKDFPEVLRRARELADECAQQGPTAPQRNQTPTPAVRSVVHPFANYLLKFFPAHDDEVVQAYLSRRGVFKEATRDEWGAITHYTWNEAKRKLLWKYGDFPARELDLLNEDGALPWPAHRLVIPWRAPDGSIDTIQRRCLDQQKTRYVFPRGRGALWPYGCERWAEHGDSVSPARRHVLD